MIDNILMALRHINRRIALVVGAVLVVTIVFILLDITLRQFGASFGGSEEISGYVMAGVASWGLAFALMEQAHVRIDFVRLKFRSRGRALMDLIAILALAATSSIIAIHAWAVLSKTLARGSTANTFLETPLWIPQSVWFSGWVWFAVSSCLMALLTATLLLKRDLKRLDSIVGTRGETETEV